MLPQHGIDIQRAAHVGGGIDAADLDMRAPFGGIDLPKIVGRYGVNVRARRRIASHAAAELIQFAGQFLLVAFPEEVD